MTKGMQAAPQSIDAEDIVFLKALLKKHKANNVNAYWYLAVTLVQWSLYTSCITTLPGGRCSLSVA